MDLLSMGEALIDFKEERSLEFQGYVGGSPLNVAVAAARLGPRVGFASQVSSDMFGDSIRSHMKANGVDQRFVLESEAPSTLAFVGEVGGEATFTFMGNGAADRLYDPTPRPVFPESLRYLMFGSVALLYEPASSAIVDTVAQHQDRVKMLLDPNVRPALITDPEAYRDKLSRWISLCHILKISTQDLDWLYPGKSPGELVEAWLESGPEVVIVTRGSKGVSLFRRGRPPLEVGSPRVEVVDTVGAGDTFSGALMVALFEQGKDLGALSDETWETVLSFAVAAAALNCTRPGADPPEREMLETFLSSR